MRLLPARRRNTSSSVVSRVDSRYSGRPSSATTSRTASRSESPSIVTSTRPSSATAGERPGGERGDELVGPRPDIDGEHAAALEQRVGGARDDEPPGVDHHDVVADLLHVVEQVGGHQHGDAERPEPGDEGKHLLPAEWIEPRRRFIEEHQLRIADERLGELGALAHAGGEPLDRPEPRLVETDEIEDVGGPLAGRSRRQAAQLSERRHDVGRRLIERQAVVLRHVAEPRPDPDRVVGDVDAAHLDAPCARMGEAEQQPERRRLAGAVRSDETDPAPRQVDREVVEGDDARVALGHAVDAEEGGFHDPLSLADGPVAVPPPHVGFGEETCVDLGGRFCEHLFVKGEATILHADLDAFFAAVEQRDDPNLRGRPVIVGIGVVMCASYEARAHGVRGAMGGGEARRLCPDAVFVTPRLSAYTDASRAVFEVFDDTTPFVEGISVDEAFLDVGGLRRIAGTPEEIARAPPSGGP